VLVERYIDRPRHVEVQVFGDRHGNYVYLFERDCSVQRRHQKVLEEAPAPGMTASRRAAMGRTAIRAAQAVGYAGAGTVEFIVDQKGAFYFIEMNTRLQVEHPVTEMITGLDLVEWQLRVAAGEALPRSQGELSMRGHAIEARIYAENPRAGFLPSTGRLLHLAMPRQSPAVRIDTGVEEGDVITADYDPMIAKLIVWGVDRCDAIERMGAALDRFQIVGPASNVELLAQLVRTPSFVEANLDTGLIEREQARLFPAVVARPDEVWLAATAAELVRREEAARRETGSPWAAIDGWRLGDRAPQVFAFGHEGCVQEVVATFVRPGEYDVVLDPGGAAAKRMRFAVNAGEGLRILCEDTSFRATVVADGPRRFVFVDGTRWDLEANDPLWVESSDHTEVGGLRAPMPGKVVTHLVSDGATVVAGAPLMVIEAMKMELTISAPRAGTVKRLHYGVGEQVPEGAELVSLVEPAA